MRIFGKKILERRPLTIEEQNARQAKERLANIKRIERERKAAEKKAKQESEATRRFEQEQQRLKRIGNIESERTRIASLKAKRASAQAGKYRGYKRTIQSAASLVGIKPKYDNYPYGQRGRAIYVSTSHGLKKINPNDPEYMGQDSYNPPPKRVTIRENRDDDYDQPSAFSGW
jgi:Na+-translocating ferredoxin:NAD+ oxidoreductase RnfC subunit